MVERGRGQVVVPLVTRRKSAETDRSSRGQDRAAGSGISLIAVNMPG
jgi:hypothetical protein